MGKWESTMENLVNHKLFDNCYQGRKVLITGHTGFKGSWLALWLNMLGANVTGLSLKPPTTPSHFELLNLPINSIIGDIRDYDLVNCIIEQTKPEIIFHLAAQAILRESYRFPRETYETNVMGTLNIFEACRNVSSIKAIINVTSDKCYENKEWIWGYRESDPMGGYDPYSSSKGCSELLTKSYRNSFFNIADFGLKHNVLLASVRAGNVIGGGDWAEYRLIPDIMKAISKSEQVEIRSPNATRPWQHVLEPLSGYLLLGSKLLKGKKEFATSWNFGPNDEGTITVRELVQNIKNYWDDLKFIVNKDSANLHEANLLKLDCSKAHNYLDWMPVWNCNKTFEVTTMWYKEFYKNNKITSIENLINYISDAREKEVSWTI
jgi:CDP-glucose 4,6-dehydratase